MSHSGLWRRYAASGKRVGQARTCSGCALPPASLGDPLPVGSLQPTDMLLATTGARCRPTHCRRGSGRDDLGWTEPRSGRRSGCRRHGRGRRLERSCGSRRTAGRNRGLRSSRLRHPVSRRCGFLSPGVAVSSFGVPRVYCPPMPVASGRAWQAAILLAAALAGIDQVRGRPVMALLAGPRGSAAIAAAAASSISSPAHRRTHRLDGRRDAGR